MKTKKVLVGCLVAVFAVGGALASVLANVNPRIQVYPTQLHEQQNDPQCVLLTEIECDDAGAFNCTVQVPVISGPDITDKAYTDSQCSIRLKNNSSVEEFSDEETFYSLVEPKL